MPTFSASISNTKAVIHSWSNVSSLTSVTILRDTRGKIRLFLEYDQNSINIAAFKTAVNCLKNDLSQSLGIYWGNKIYYMHANTNALENELISQANQLRVLDEIESSGLRWYIIERAVAKKAWVELNGNQQPIWNFDDACNGIRPKVVTFYSFKGGMGRTTAMAAVILGLANKGKNVLAIDTDIEAPGLSSLFLPESNINKGVVDYFIEYSLGNISNISDYIYSVTDATLTDGFQGQIYIVPAGKQDDNYLSKLSRVDCQEINNGNLRNSLESLMNATVDELVNSSVNIDYVLMDARAGFHDLGGIVTTQIPHGIVLFGKESKQSWNGLKQVVNSIAHSQPSENLPWVAIVDSGCGVSGYVSQEEKELFRKSSYEIFDCYYAQQEVTLPALGAEGVVHDPIYIPFQAMLTKDLQLYIDDLGEDELKGYKYALMTDSYNIIIQRIMEWFDK